MSKPDPRTPPGCYDGDPELLPVADAIRRIDAHLRPLGEHEEVALRDALGRVLARPIVSPIDVPGHTNSAMDGYAVHGADLPQEGERALRVLGTSRAGRPHPGAVAPGETVKVMTGAVMPDGTDTVIMQEHVRVDGAHIVVGPGHQRGQHVRARGEDIAKASVVLDTGKRLMPAELGLLGSLGIAQVPVFRRLRVAFFSTGDELRSIGEPLAAGEVYDSNRYTLYAMLTRLGVEVLDLGVVRDDAQALGEALREAAREADAVITSGGASTGEADHVRDVLGALGEVGFWRIAIRPGRPLAFGRIENALYFGLPGNPVAVMVTFYQLVQPALQRMSGERASCAAPTMQATCTSRLRKKRGRVEVYRAILAREADGALTVRSTGKTGSGLLHTMSNANCFVVLPEDGETVEPGTLVDVVPFFGLI